MPVDDTHPQLSAFARAAESIDRDRDAALQALERQARQNVLASVATLLELAELFPAAALASERAEHERIVKRYGKDDPRAKALEISLDALERMDLQTSRGRARAARAMEVAGAPAAAAFHGFVSEPSGEPAAGKTVRVASPKLREALSAATGPDGYFRVPLPDKVERAAVETAADLAQVTIEDGSGKRLLEDPLPLELGGGSAYREYVLPERGRPERGRTER